MTHSNPTAQYFNLTADGIGFFNRPRIVQNKKGSPYFACTIQASRGDDGSKSRFDLRVVGGRAKELFAQLLEDFPEFKSNNYKNFPTVVVGFRAGDIQPITFETTDRKTGEKIVTPSIDGRLLKFKFIKVDGEYWYTEQNDMEHQVASADPSSGAPIDNAPAKADRSQPQVNRANDIPEGFSRQAA